MSAQYENLTRERSRAVRDHTDLWRRLQPISQAGEQARAAVEQFCAGKRITFAALEQLGARVTDKGDVGYCLAYGGSNGNGKVCAIKYRPLNGTSHDSFAEKPSVWLRPIVIGNRDSTDWLIAEGETDAAGCTDSLGTAARSWRYRRAPARFSPSGRT